MCRVLFSLIVLVFLTHSTTAQTPATRTKLAVLDFGSSKVGKQSSTTIRTSFSLSSDIDVLDSDLTAAAAKGAGYSGSLNMSLSEARDLGSALGSEFYLLGDAQTLRRSSSNAPLYYESYLSLFLISARTGRLIFWDRLNAESNKSDDSEAMLLQHLSGNETTEQWLRQLRKAQANERTERAADLDLIAPIIEEAPSDEKATPEMGLSLPKPYRRLRPPYPDSAARADIEATVDVLVDVGADGEINQVRVARWACFGLDETTVATVRQLHFFPAMRDGNPIPMRVLLRYNFRKPTQ
jgi:TonB family protein